MKRKEVRQIVRNMNIIDDTLFQKMAEDIGFCEEMISTFPKVSKRKSQFKREEGGEREVCEAVENYGKECAREAVKETAKETAYNFFKNGASYEMVKASMSSLTEEELMEIYKKAKK